MSNSASRDGDISRLHPAIRDKVKAIRDQLHKEKIPFEVFEAFRTPERQAQLFAQGRTAPGPKVTWVGPWRSIHQYGLAVDFVLKFNGQWSWDDQGAEAAHWDRMHVLAKQHGMTPLYKNGRLIEKPHIQLDGVSSTALSEGRYPAGGDAVWAEWLSSLIDNWEGGGAPPHPTAAPEPPGIDPEIMAQLEEDPGALPLTAVDMTPDAAAANARFLRLHAFIRQWEGGFVHHPEDDGGATNMGITLATLSAWRKTSCTVDDVRNLTREEADEILRTSYYAVCRCGELPERTAIVLYNGAVMHGPRRAVEFLQTAFNNLGMTADGEPLKVDGVLGPKTMAGARQTDASVLAEAYMDVQDAYFRAHADFEHFGVGWLNRLSSLRDFVSNLPHGSGLRPKTVMKISDRKTERERERDRDLDLDLDVDAEDVLRLLLIAATGGKSAVASAILRRLLLSEAGAKGVDIKLKGLLAKVLADRLDLDLSPQAETDLGTEVKKVLTPVNAALGETVGRALDGKKSVIGIIGLITTAVLPQLGILDTEAATALASDDTQTLLFTLLSIFTGWGFLGKIDKAIYNVRSGLSL